MGPTKQKQKTFKKFVYATFPILCKMIEFSKRLLVQNWHCAYFLCHCFVFLHNCSFRIGSPGLTWNLLKVNSRDCISLLTAFNMFKALFKCFSCVLCPCLCLLGCFHLYDFFFNLLLSVLNRLHAFIYFKHVLILIRLGFLKVVFSMGVSLTTLHISRKTNLISM